MSENLAASTSAAPRVPRWVGIAALIAALGATAGMLASAAIPGGNIVFGLVSTAGLVALALTAPPLAIAAARRRRASAAVVGAVAIVLIGVVGTATGQPMRVGVETATGALEAAHTSSTCPATAGIYRVLACEPTNSGTLFFIDGAGLTFAGGFAVLDLPADTTRVTATDGSVVSVRSLGGKLFEFSLPIMAIERTS